MPSPAPRCHMSLQIEHHFVAPGLVKRPLFARRRCAKSHAAVGQKRQNAIALDGRRGAGLRLYRV